MPPYDEEELRKFKGWRTIRDKKVATYTVVPTRHEYFKEKKKEIEEEYNREMREIREKARKEKKERESEALAKAKAEARAKAKAEARAKAKAEEKARLAQPTALNDARLTQIKEMDVAHHAQKKASDYRQELFDSGYGSGSPVPPPPPPRHGDSYRTGGYDNGATSNVSIGKKRTREVAEVQ
jgi:membrane protein involved in colicin uptake